MAEKKNHPKPGETWFHPLTFNAYEIHSITDDGWVRYRVLDVRNRPLTTSALFTEPTLDFTRKYKKQNDTR